MTELVDAALAWHDEGFCILPAGAKKMPALSTWKQFQTERPSREQVQRWAEQSDGIGMLCGAISGEVEMLEIEASAVDLLTPFLSEVGKLSATLLAKLMTYVEISARGGYHWIYRVEEGPIAGNTKLAGSATHETWIETRGEGGWTVLAPSGGRVSPEGGTWRIAEGSPGVVATMTADERDALHRIARTFDQAPAVQVSHHEARPVIEGELTPGQDYNLRHTWAEVLEPEGWTFDHQEGETGFWLRPGKKRGEDHSATTNYGGSDVFYVFTSSTAFPQKSHWTKFGFYAFTHHDGDYSAAAKELRRQKYGSPPKVSTAQAERQATLSLIQGGQSSTTDGSSALSPEEKSSPALPPLKLTELGNARLFAEVESPRIRYVPQRSAWVAWRDARWEWQPTGRDGTCPVAVQAMVELIETMKPADEHALKWMIKSASERSIKAAIRLAAHDPRVVAALDRFDAKPEELNTPSGVVDLRTEELRSPTPEDMHTRLTGVGIDFDAECPRWLRFLADTFDGDQEMIDFLQRLAGYAATGEVTHHVLPFFYGSGANGKSVFLEVLMAILGEYAAPAQSELLLAGRDTHESFIAMMSGLRLIVANEVGPTAKFNEQRVKQFTGGDQITSRRLNHEPFTFKPTHTLVMAGNHQPRVDSGGPSLWRRVMLVGFNHTVPEEKRIAGLADQLIRDEGPAILAWVVRGAVWQYKVGLMPPEGVTDATRAYAESEDHLGRFLDERVRFGGDGNVLILKGDLYAAYKAWCHEEGEVDSMLPATTFGKELKSRGVGEKKSNSRRFYTNVTLVNAERDLERDTAVQLIYGD